MTSRFNRCLVLGNPCILGKKLRKMLDFPMTSFIFVSSIGLESAGFVDCQYLVKVPL